MIKKKFVIKDKKYAEAYSDAVEMWKQFVMTEFGAGEPQSWPSPNCTHYGDNVWMFEFEDDVVNVEPGWS